MKHLALVGFILLAMVPNTDTTKELITIEKGFNSALVRSDWKAVERMYADDLIFTNADGSVTHKPDEVAAVRSGDIKMDSIEMSDERVQDFGDVAVTTGKCQAHSETFSARSPPIRGLTLQEIFKCRKPQGPNTHRLLHRIVVCPSSGAAGM